MSVLFSLSGGGTMGAYQVGMLRRAFELKIKPDLIVGTSIGALNALGYSVGGIDEVEKFWLGIEKRSQWLRLNWRRAFLDGYFDLTPVRKTVERLCERPFRIPFQVTYTDLKDFTLNWVDSSAPKDLLIDAIVASCIQPVIMRPVRDTWVDGGVLQQIPMSAHLTTFDQIYFMLARPTDVRPEPGFKPKFPKIVTLGVRTLETMLDEMYRDSVEEVSQYFVIAPTEPVIGGLEFEPIKVRQAIEHGYNRAKSMMINGGELK